MTTEISQAERDRLIALDPSLDPEAQRSLTVRQYDGFGASDLDRREHDTASDAQATLYGFEQSPRWHTLPGGEEVGDLASAVACVMTEDEVDSWLTSRNEPGDRLAAAQNCLADMIFGKRFMRRSLGSVTWDTDGRLSDLYSPVFWRGDTPDYISQVYFIEVSPTGLLARAGFRPASFIGDDGTGLAHARALAVRFYAVDHYINRKGAPSLSFYRTDKGDPIWDLPCQYFRTVDSAIATRDKVRRAIAVLRRDARTSFVPDQPLDDRPSPTIGA